MNKVFLFLLSSFILFFCNIGLVWAIDIYVPWSQWNENIVVAWPTQVDTDEWTLFEIIQIVNEYLRFSVWFFCLIVLIIGGFKIITAEWNSDKLKKANKITIWGVIWIFIAILSYAAVRLIVNLFQ